MIGKNIKKIRGVKRLSQQAFADLFGLKRGTLAAYEEGRSSPRLETVIKIASHFNIDMDELLKTELTVNRLLQFNDTITTNSDPLPVQQFARIPCITDALETDFIHQRGEPGICQRLPQLQLPLPESKGYIGYTVHSAEMTQPGGTGFLPRDLVVGKILDTNSFKTLKRDSPVLVLTDQKLIFRFANPELESCELHPAAEGLEPITLVYTEIIKVWEILHVFHWKIPPAADTIEQRLLQLEQTMKNMKEM